jgi:hypothetical protein
MSRRKDTKKFILRTLINDQRKWIDSRGGNAAGYVERYGNYGAGGEAIYNADVAQLRKLETELAGLGE